MRFRSHFAGLLVVFFALSSVARAGASSANAAAQPSGGTPAAELRASLTPDPPRALGARGLANEVAFARLFGYVRFFHPSDEAAHADWNAIAIMGAHDVEGAQTAEECAAVLQSLFAPVAPTLRVFATRSVGEPLPAPPAALSPPPQRQGISVTMWVHHGYGGGLLPQPIYVSRRETTPWGGDLSPPFADPRVPLLVDAAGGVSALLPVALFTEAEGTLPHGAPPGSPVLLGGGLETRAVRLGSIAFAWTIFQHFYPYFDVVHSDWDVALVTALREAAVDDRRSEFRDTLARLVAALGDGHGQVSDPEAPPSGGLPLTWGSVEGRLLVLDVADGVPGVQRGDVVAGIDGVAIGEALARAEALESAATPQHRRWKALLALARGAPGKTVRLSLASPSGGPHAVTLAFTDGSSYAWTTERRPNPITELRPGVWYVDLDRVTDTEFSDRMATLAGASGIVFDLRGYPHRIGPQWMTHLTDQPLESAFWKVPIVTRPDRHDWRLPADGRWFLPPTSPRFTAKLAFLIDARTVSYAESTAGILEAYRLGALVGEPTAGTNGNINPFRTPAGFVLSWTGMRVVRNDGAVHHGHGIRPTLVVHKTIAGVTAGRDEQLEAAVRAVSPAH